MKASFLHFQAFKISAMAAGIWSVSHLRTISADERQTFTQSSLSIDRIAFEPQHSATNIKAGFESVVSVGGHLVAVGSRYQSSIFAGLARLGPGITAVSTNGIVWVPTHTNQFALHSVACGKEGCVAVGDSGAILFSRDAMRWKQANSTGTNRLWSISYGANLWVAVGDHGAITTSQDGLDWTTRDDPSNSRYVLSSVAYGAGRFVAVGGDHLGTSISSVDGQEWVHGQFTDNVFGSDFPPMFASTVFLGIAYGNGRFLAAGGAGRVYTSTNGVDWTRSTRRDDDWTARSVTYAEGRFIATIQGGVISSRDGVKWRRDFSFPLDGLFLRAVAYADTNYVACGYRESPYDISGAILLGQGSKPVIDSIENGAGIVGMSFSGGTALRYGVEASGSVSPAVWRRIGEVPSTNGTGSFDVPNSPESSARFYRLVSP